MSLENLDMLISWHINNPQYWSKLKFTPSVIENYKNKRKQAKEVVWCIGLPGWNHLVKNYNKYYVETPTMNFTQNEVKQVMDKVKSKTIEKPKSTNFFDDYIYPEKDWTIQTKIDFYKYKGYKVPNRLKPFMYKPEPVEITPVKNDSIYDDEFWNNFGS